MLLGRRHEQQIIATLAAQARVGQSGVLVITGEAGCGKTSLLQEVAGTLHEMQVCRVIGSEAERDLGFGGLSQLLGADLADLADLPAPQARALEVALNLKTGADVDRLAIGAGTLGLLSQRAESRALAVLVDDAHLLDHSSSQAITFAARRLLADPILILATVRTGEDSPLLHAGLPVLELTGLDVDAAARLLSGRTGRPVPAARVEQLVRATQGNPLALLELSATPEQLDAIGPHDPIAVRAALARAFLRRAEQLSTAARDALLVVACSGGAPPVVHDACRILGIDPTVLAEAGDADLIHSQGTIEFQHPLVRAAIIGVAEPERLRAVHAALAAATPAPDADRRAWHLAAAAAGPDREAAQALELVAQRASERSAHDVASTALERAGWLSPAPLARTTRLLSAAESAWLAGQGERALALLGQVGELEPAQAELVARAGHLRGTVASRTGSLTEAVHAFHGTALAVQDSHPDAAAELWADAVNAAFYRADTPFLRHAAESLEGLLPRVSTARSRVLGELATGMARTLTGGNGADLIRRSVDHMAATDTLHADPLRAEWLVLGPLYLREEGGYRTLVHRALTETREAGALGELSRLLLLVALDDAATDRWARADSEYEEGIQLAREAGNSTDLALALAGSAWLEARIGRDASCRAHAEESARICLEKDIVIGRVWCGLALGELELGSGRAAEALTHVDAVQALLEESGLRDMDLHPGPEQVEALARLGRMDEARALADEYHRLSSAKGQAWVLARAERAQALVAADPEDAWARFALATELHAGTPDRFEAARTLLAYGATLRRHRRRRDARAPLREALTVFEDLGAEQRAEQASRELAASGERLQRKGASRLTTLTAQERQIGELLSEGQTTRQAAATLFLSPKTVEYHLRHIYTKLDVRSRDELAQALREG